MEKFRSDTQAQHYDARTWLRDAEKSFSRRVEKSFEDLNGINRN